MEPSNAEETMEGTTEAAPADPAMAEGVLEGGWSFIWAAYIMTWCFLLGYAIYVNVRREMSRPPADPS